MKKLISVLSIFVFVTGLVHGPFSVAAPVDSASVGAVSPAVTGSQPQILPRTADERVSSQKIVLEAISGEVWVDQASGQSVAATNGFEISPKDIIRTGETGGVRISFDGAASVFIGPNAELAVSEAYKKQDRSRTTLLKLNQGKIKAMVNHLDDKSTFDITTPTAVASVRGTVLYLNVRQMAEALANKMTELYVDEGKVDFSTILDRLKNILVDQYGVSAITGSGDVMPLRHLTAEERQAFLEAFEEAFKNLGNPQTETEETDAGDQGEDEGEEGGDEGETDESLRDLLSEQNLRNTGTLVDVRPEILGLLVLSGLDQLGSEVAITNQEENKDAADRVTNGDKEYAEWSYEAVRLDNEEFDHGDAGVVGQEGLDAFDEIFGLLKNSSAEFEDIEDRIEELFELLDQAQQNPANEALLPPAHEANESTAESFTNIALDTAGVVEKLNNIKQLRAAERAKLKAVLARIVSNQQELEEQALIEHQFDAQTGKVFKDVHGNRVRTDQYIDRPESNEVRMTSLTYRATGDYAGVSAFIWSAIFNQSIQNESLRELPWNDYLNVVTWSELRDLVDPQYNIPNSIRSSSQYIVHNYAEGDANAPSLYPVEFRADFYSAIDPDVETKSNRILFTEDYSNPKKIYTGTASGDHIWVQGLTDSETSVFSKNANLPVARGAGLFTIPSFLDSKIFAQDGLTQESLADFDPLRPENNPAYAVTLVSPTCGDDNRCSLKETLASLIPNMVVAQFIPIDNEGNIVSEDGFRLNGLRDFVNPDPNVNGGNYNLEIILQYGEFDFKRKLNFESEFTIDTIVTPEILHEVFNTLRAPEEDDDDDDSGCQNINVSCNA